ncbi:hypothetical protein VWS36_003257, partial [Cronobacter sakazakii]|nr:hypothetical protein [Cronobacter sakazakii]EMC4127876.1 hypothetical protein [Cronobacter sakazakii]EMD7586761.1 hypothetical protein [Cronobacter sakazakii]EME1795264.1 hypothetical protein [Cronobacter sakazakii]EME1926587.1 hypothetical protein [Cronobacter sakazakii]
SEVIASEIADFFADFGGPGEPDIQSGEAQRLLTERLLSVMALRERAEPVEHESHIRREVNVGGNTWVQCSKQAFQREKARGALCRVLYELPTEPPAPVVDEWTNEQCLEFLAVAFRHAEIKGDFELDDLRLGVKMANAMTPVKEVN